MINDLRNFWRKITNGLFGKVKLEYKSIFFIILAIAAGHICDDYYQSKFPVFKICFGLVGLMMYSNVSRINKHDEEE